LVINIVAGRQVLERTIPRLNLFVESPTGIYAVHHIRRSSGEHPTVAGSAWPVILLLAVLLFASCVKACA
jgi:hypothetical protein